jgi:3-oxoacyl-[acyl-carrier-protein] synthase II
MEPAPAERRSPEKEGMERVVVTGLGLVTPNGIGVEQSWQSLVNGQSGVGPITLFDTEGFATRIAAEVKGFEPADFMERKKIKEVGRFIPFAMAATKMALEQAQLDLTDEDRERAGVFIGVGLGGLENLERCTLTLEHKGPGKVSPYFIPSLIANMAAGQVSIAFGLRGPTLSHTSACSSSAHAIGEALRWMQRGDADVMVAGGAEATISPIGIAGFSAMFALSRRNDDPAGASRPWDKGRDGFVCGEGAGTLVLETLTRAKKRGARILAEVIGYGATSDAYHITKPSPSGVGGARAMRLALKDAKIAADQIDYVNAHGTSTPAGDTEESKAIADVCGAHALDKKLWVSSTKSMMGHLLGAAGAVESGVCLKAIETGIVPPTINLVDPDPECILDFVPLRARERRVRRALTNSFGFGGTNACLVFSAFEG